MDESTVESSVEVVIDLTKKELIQVLHVDDEAGFLKVAKQCLEMQDTFRVETAFSVDEALKRMKKKTFDVIVSDYQMPGKDGLEFLKELRDTGNNVPFIMFTGRGREEVAIRALNLGADQYLNKTGDPETVYGELAHGIRKIVKAKRDEERVRESEEKYRSLFENARDVTLTLDLKGKITSINKAAEEYGFRKDKIIGKNMLKFTPKKYWPKLLKELAQLARGKSVEGKIEIITPKGKKTAEYNSNPIIVNSRVVGVQAILKDVTERKKAEEKITKSEERLRAIFASSPDSVTVTDLHGNIMECNQATSDMLGFSSKEELIGISGLALVAKKDREKVKENLKNLLKQGLTKDTQYTALTKDGREFIAELSSSVVKDSSGNPTGFVSITQDITERKRVEETLSHERELIQTLLEHHPDFIYFKDREARFHRVSKRFCDFFKCTMEDIIGKTDLELFPKEVAEQTYSEDLHVIKTGTPLINKEESAAGTWVLTTKIPWADKEGNIIGLFGISRDITERKQAEVEIEAGSKRLEDILDTIADSVCITDLDANITMVSKAMVDLFGIPKERLLTMNGLDLAIKEDMPKVSQIMQDLVKTGLPQNAEVTGRLGKAKGRSFWIRFSLLRNRKGDPARIVTVTRDITEHKKILDELRSSEERLKILFEFAPDAYYLNDLKGNFADGNKAAEELTGYSRSELVGKNFLKLKLLSRKQVMKAAKLLVKNALGKSTGPDEFVLNRKDGTPVSVEIRTFPVKIKDQTLVLGIARDISERKRAEAALKAMNEKLRVVGRLTRHDVRNKLSGIMGNVFLAKRKLTGEHESLKYLREIGPATSQIERIFDFARTYEKLGIEELVYIDVEKSLKEAVMQFSDLHSVKVVNDCCGLMVLADSLLRQVFYNLIDNSLKYGEKVSRIRVYYEEVGENQLRLVYEDDGVGIAEGEKARIFLEGYGRGTGYGLYLVKRICEVYGWSIRETGKLGKGAQFTITIPEMGGNGKICYKVR